MKRINIVSVLLALLFVTSCDYNDDNFAGYDKGLLTDVGFYEGVFPNDDYPSAGYFTDNSSLESAMDKMLKGILLYPDKDYMAQVSVLFGDVAPGYSTADAQYELKVEDYDSMGTEAGQPGKYDNFDNKMDVDSYLQPFCAEKFASMADGAVVSITYKYYVSNAGTSSITNSYKKVSGLWIPTELNPYTADSSYTLKTEDYDSMGTEYGTPGRYDSFNSNINPNDYLPTFLKIKYPYLVKGKTVAVTYVFFVANVGNVDRTDIYKYDGDNWSLFDPYKPSVDVKTKVAEMIFDGTNWVINRILGGSQKVVITGSELTYLLDWVKENKSSYLKNEEEEFYFGAGVTAKYQNINNSYSNWKANDPNGAYAGLTDANLQLLMDERLQTGFITIVLPKIISEPNPELSYDLAYNVYGGRGSGNYVMSFMYDATKSEYYYVSGPVKE